MSAVILEDQVLRDGLQFEKAVLSLEEKVRIFELLVAAGVKRIQVGSFVHPKYVPQMADTDELISRIKDTPGVSMTGLALNETGLERAVKCGLKNVGMGVSVSDTHSRRNTNRPAAQALTEMTELIAKATSLGLNVGAGVMCAFGCVYEGHVPEAKVLEAAEALAEAGASKIGLADTTGMGNPLQVRRLLEKVKRLLPGKTLSLHLHDTRGMGLANMVAGYEGGVEIFDAAAGGLGGCPFVKGASGNVATEDAAHMFEAMGVDTGIDLGKLCRVVEALEEIFDRRLPGKMCSVLKAIGTCS